MANESATIVQRLWNYCNVLPDEGVSSGDYVEQLTYLLFPKMAEEQTPSLTTLNFVGELKRNSTWAGFVMICIHSCDPLLDKREERSRKQQSSCKTKTNVKVVNDNLQSQIVLLEVIGIKNVISN